MPLEPGQDLAHYRLVERIGEGGMGVVWKALDTTLEREVAIKILPDAFASDAERLARFEREAKLLASLNHPNIAAVYGLHEADTSTGSVRFLAMELVSGEDLADRLNRGPLPVDEAMQVARRIAEGLQAAHDQGVIHRDLKPANVRLTPEGRVKVLDFGLAKAIAGGTASGSGQTSQSLSPTMTSAGTVAGMILGTAGYMSPEQARGTPVDRRADVWAFGCVVWEMLTAEQLFRGNTVSDTLAAVLRATPDPGSLPADTPPSVRRLLRRCLEKDPESRLHDIADARLEIEDALGDDPDATETAAPEAKRKGAMLPWILTAVLAVVAVIAMVQGRGGGDPAPAEMHVSVALPQQLEIFPGQSGAMVADLSPDGRLVAFTARREDTVRLYLRSLDSTTITEIAASDNASDPSFSPDGRWIAFVGPAGLARVSVQGGTPAVLAEAPSSRGTTWIDNDTIVFAPAYTSGLARISAAGGDPEILTTPDPERSERTHRWPHVLPGGRGVLYTIGTLDQPGNYEDASIAVLDLDSGQSRVLIEGGSIARYASGHVLYSRGGELLAVPFDLAQFEVTGPPTPVLDGVAREVTSGAVQFAISDDGTMMFVRDSDESNLRNLMWVDRQGRTERISELPQPFLGPRISPDGQRVAFTIGPGLGDGDIWIHDLSSGQRTRLTFDTFNIGPVWTPDGERIVYGVTQGGATGVAWKPTDGSEEGEMIVRTDGRYASIPSTWIPGGQGIVFTRAGGKGGGDLFSMSVGDPEPVAVLEGPNLEGGATFSPDGKWFAYTSNETGRLEIFVRPYPGPGGQWQVSSDGGKGPVWSRDGTEIFYGDGDKLMSVQVRTEPTFSPGTPRMLFEMEFERDVGTASDFAVTPDGKRFLMIARPLDDPRTRQIDLVLGFATRLDE